MMPFVMSLPHLSLFKNRALVRENLGDSRAQVSRRCLSLHTNELRYGP